jgi:hypothetical protein
VAELEPGEARARRDLVEQVRRYWIGTELAGALGDLPRIDLALEDRPEAVDDPLRVAADLAEPRQPVRRAASIREVYRQAGDRLLLLGDPGAGKTTLLLELTSELIEEPPEGRMPVVFHLASWAESRQPLARWLVAELHRRYGVAPRLGRSWIADERVLPLLDGLDEVAEEHRGACVAAINGFLDAHGQLPVAVCCRTAEYEAPGARLRLRGAVAIRPVTADQAAACLAAAGEAGAELRPLVREDGRLRELLTTPLFLRIVLRAYGDGAPRPSLPRTLAERRGQVLADYVGELLLRPRAGGPSPAFPAERTGRWLAWLAAGMRERSEGVFQLDWMQPAWLPGRLERWAVTLAPAAVVVLVGVLAGMLDLLLAGVVLGDRTYLVDVDGGVSLSLPGRPGAALLEGAVVGLAAGLLAAVFTFEPRIAPTTRLTWSSSTIRRHVPVVLAAVLGALSLALLLDRVAAGVAAHLVYGLLLVTLFMALTRAPRRAAPRGWGLVAAMAALAAALAVAAALSGAPPATLAYRVAARLVVGLGLGLMFGPRAPLCETVPAPGRAIAASRRHGAAAGVVSAAVATLIFGVVAGTSVGLAAGARAGIATGLADGIAIGLIAGAGVAMRRGSGAHLRHVLLCRLLARGQEAPPDLAGFLAHAAGLILLRRRGGGYEFVHRLLLDHLADQGPPGAPRPPAAAGREERQAGFVTGRP